MREILCFLDLKSHSSEIHHTSLWNCFPDCNIWLEESLLEFYLVCIYHSTFPINQNTLDQCDQDIDSSVSCYCRATWQNTGDKKKCFWSANWPLLWACPGTCEAGIFLLDNLERKGDINHLWVYESQYTHFSCYKTLEILTQTHQWYETQLTANFIVRQDIMG